MPTWSWGMSDLRTNTLRGVLAEFIVSRAVGSASAGRVEWDAYDVMTPEGVKVEVKACAYLQGWPQTSLTRIVFSGLSARVLDPETNGYAGERQYNADVYVFAVQTATSHDALGRARHVAVALLRGLSGGREGDRLPQPEPRGGSAHGARARFSAGARRSDPEYGRPRRLTFRSVTRTMSRATVRAWRSPGRSRSCGSSSNAMRPCFSQPGCHRRR